MKKLLFAMALGAALAWLFDPEAGSRRRQHARQRLEDSGLIAPSAHAPAVRWGASADDLGAPLVASVP